MWLLFVCSFVLLGGFPVLVLLRTIFVLFCLMNLTKSAFRDYFFLGFLNNSKFSSVLW